MVTVETLKKFESLRPRPMLWCPCCGDEWSADAGDYFWRDPGKPFVCECGEPLVLVRKETRHIRVRLPSQTTPSAQKP